MLLFLVTIFFFSFPLARFRSPSSHLLRTRGIDLSQSQVLHLNAFSRSLSFELFVLTLFLLSLQSHKASHREPEVYFFFSTHTHRARESLEMADVTHITAAGHSGEFPSFPTHGGQFIQYKIFGNLFEITNKYRPPIMPMGRGAYGIVW